MCLVWSFWSSVLNLVLQVCGSSSGVYGSCKIYFSTDHDRRDAGTAVVIFGKSKRGGSGGAMACKGVVF